MSKHHHRDRCRERYENEQGCRERMYLAYPMGSMPGAEPDQSPSFSYPGSTVETMQEYGGGSCYMTPTGPVCPGTGNGGSCYMGPQGMVCPAPGSGGGSCYMTPQGRVCRPR